MHVVRPVAATVSRHYDCSGVYEAVPALLEKTDWPNAQCRGGHEKVLLKKPKKKASRSHRPTAFPSPPFKTVMMLKTRGKG